MTVRMCYKDWLPIRFSLNPKPIILVSNKENGIFQKRGSVTHYILGSQYEDPACVMDEDPQHALQF